MRLNLFLARAGRSSRREADRWIRTGRVRINGRPPSGMGDPVDPERDRITLDGTLLALPRAPRYLAYYKPRGLLVTRAQERGRPTIYDALGEDARGLHPVGRLDRESEGLLLLTDDGRLAEALLHPRNAVPRLYEVRVSPVPDPAAMRALRRGTEVDGAPVKPRRVVLEGSEAGEGILLVELAEGRKREIRVLARTAGLRVARLVRVAFGPIRLGGLKPGATRPLRGEEIERLRVAASRAAPGAPRGRRAASPRASRGDTLRA
ncbi:MAG TPA: pseudouridine synthase [Candidatus Eisenbacteria bacterium]